jgi:hypothetical protein
MSAGQATVGGCESMTVILKLHMAVAPAGSVPVQATVVTPFGKTDPGEGEQATVAPPQSPLTVGFA